MSVLTNDAKKRQAEIDQNEEPQFIPLEYAQAKGEEIRKRFPRILAELAK